ncbi:MAG: cytochrome c oxidase assembly protein [Burkholderiales bacterium]
MSGNPSAEAAPSAPEATASRAAANASLLKRLGVIVVGMFGFGYLLVPFYEKICQATGLRNIAAPDVVSNTQVDATRSVRIEFDSNLRNLPWTFKPLQGTTSVNPGEVGQVLYEVANRTDRPITGQAIPSYAPQEARRFFKKLYCFCFAKQTLQAGEVRQMPVVFVIDPEMPRDIGTITLSYTFFEVEGAGAKR